MFPLSHPSIQVAGDKENKSHRRRRSRLRLGKLAISKKQGDSARHYTIIHTFTEREAQTKTA